MVIVNFIWLLLLKSWTFNVNDMFLISSWFWRSGSGVRHIKAIRQARLWDWSRHNYGGFTISVFIHATPDTLIPTIPLWVQWVYRRWFQPSRRRNGEFCVAVYWPCDQDCWYANLSLLKVKWWLLIWAGHPADIGLYASLIGCDPRRLKAS